eukprot:12049141-Alexandrium_andersonii.AAC.1
MESSPGCVSSMTAFSRAAITQSRTDRRHGKGRMTRVLAGGTAVDLFAKIRAAIVMARIASSSVASRDSVPQTRLECSANTAANAFTQTPV